LLADNKKAPVQCWDNSTRGLDASTALDFGRELRNSAHEQQKTIIASFYQTGNALYNNFDKVLVLCEGRQIYYGPSQCAKTYFEDMGFECLPGGSVADFLSSVSVQTERNVRAGYELSIPNTAEEFEKRYKQSDTYRAMMQSIVEPETLNTEIQDLAQAMTQERERSRLLKHIQSVYTVSLPQQVVACTLRFVDPIPSLQCDCINSTTDLYR
jgi:ABC-type multidrug transport system ATPase subunit